MNMQLQDILYSQGFGIRRVCSGLVQQGWVELWDTEANDWVRCLDSTQDIDPEGLRYRVQDRKSTRLNSSHGYISYAVFCLKKKKKLCKVLHVLWRWRALPHGSFPASRFTPAHEIVLATTCSSVCRITLGCVRSASVISRVV